MSKPKTVAPTRDGYRKELMDLLRMNSYRHDLYTIWSDFVELGAITYSNTVDLQRFDEREARFMQITSKYTPDEITRFAQSLGALTMAMEYAQFDDVLGATFMELELGNKWHGQFFTPYSLCAMMARMNVDANMGKIIEANGFVLASDPCVGGGAMPIALAQAMFDAGYNPQQQLHVTVQDIDLKAVHMAYMQLTLLHIPAIVIHGNTLANEQNSIWYTPAHILGGWTFRLKKPRKEIFEDGIKPVSTIQLTYQSSLFEEAA